MCTKTKLHTLIHSRSAIFASVVSRHLQRVIDISVHSHKMYKEREESVCVCVRVFSIFSMFSLIFDKLVPFDAQACVF